MSILVVDDSLATRSVLQMILEGAGYQPILLVESAHEAFQRLGLANSSAPTEDIELVLMDIRMPDMDGVEACRRIKTDNRYRDLPILMVTAMTESGFLQAAFAAGAVDYVTKPIDRLELLTRMRSTVSLKHEMDRRKAREKELEQALKEIKVLRGILSICARCKRIRDERGQWYSVESYIKGHSEADFSHLICPDCLDRHFPM
ncbi:MAG TPA: response regulator [Nitrospirales bacterium]|jgi:CheY-like chemotaxis protein|nr:response regulator [Nitrospirales bacterium]